jgi:hypothetical protein
MLCPWNAHASGADLSPAGLIELHEKNGSKKL